MGFLEDALVHGLFSLRHWPFHLSVVHLDAFFDGAIALVLAHVAPRVLDVWHGAFVDCRGVRRGELEEHLASDGLAVQLLRFDSLKDLRAKQVHLLDEFRPEFLVGHLLQALQLALLLDWSHHGEAVAVGEHLLDQPTDPILDISRI